MMIKKTVVPLLLVFLFILLGIYLGCEDDNGTGPEPTATPTNTPTTSVPTNSPTPTPTSTAHPINGCWDFQITQANCTGELQTICDIICSLFPSLNWQMQFEKREGNVVHIWIQDESGNILEINGILEGNELTIRIPCYIICPGPTIPECEFVIILTLEDGTMNGTLTTYAMGNWDGQDFYCTIIAVVLGNKKSPAPCIWE